MKKIITAFLCVIALPLAAQTNSQRSFLPPTMGWSSWNTYGAKISDSIICSQADAAVKKGFAQAGYIYINIDDGFFFNRNAEGRLQIHPERFPNGLRPVVDYIHSRGLKAGIYSDAGSNTCASFWGDEKEPGGIGAGMLGHEEQDCKMYFNEMDFDFIKVDFCGGAIGNNFDNIDLNRQERYTEIGNAIKATGKKVIYNLCCWNFPGVWARDISDSWRVSEDIWDGWPSVKSIANQSLYLSAYCGNGHYNDMDMLEVGRSMSEVEDLTHFAMWCIMSSPLMIGCDMNNVSDKARELLCNPELIALNQDRLGLQAYVATTSNDTYTLVKDIETLYGNTRAVAIYNPSENEQTVTLKFSDIDLGGKVLLRNLATRSDIGSFTDSYTTTIPAHGTAIMKATAETRLTRTLYEAETAWLSAYQEIRNHEFEGTAIYENDTRCSGGVKASWLGRKPENDLQWRNVNVDKAGTYDITLAYLSPEKRSINVSVNGKKQTTLTCNTAPDGATIKLRLRLQKGENTIRLYNDTQKMPDIDYMRIAINQNIDKNPLRRKGNRTLK